jgi:hypothetical protein
MGKLSNDNRINYLIEQYCVFDIDDITELLLEYEAEKFINVIKVRDPLNDSIIGIISERYKSGTLKKVYKFNIELTILGRMISADPSKNKMFIQWMLKVFMTLLKTGKHVEAIRFACEDLPMAKEYLVIFESNKRKVLFDKYCEANFNLAHIKDYSDINQYNSLSELFDAIDPFVEKDISGLKRGMNRFVDIGEGEITFKDRYFTVFTPKSIAASRLFGKFASWCTTFETGTMYDRYTKQLTPDKRLSKLYIIIPSEFFEGTSDAIYQIHFESNQFNDKSNRPVTDSNLLDKSESLKNYILNVLKGLIESNSSIGYINNEYSDWLYRYHLGYLVFNFMDINLRSIRFRDSTILTVPTGINRFKKLQRLVITGAKINSVHDNIGELSELELLSLSRNNITSLPNSISNLKKLTFLSLTNNPIKRLPKEISELDMSNGGSLRWVSVNNSEVIREVERYLPNVTIINT